MQAPGRLAVDLDSFFQIGLPSAPRADEKEEFDDDENEESDEDEDMEEENGVELVPKEGYTLKPEVPGETLPVRLLDGALFPNAF